MFDVGCSSRTLLAPLSSSSHFMSRALQYVAGLLLLAAGCAEYHLGVGSLYRPDIRTVGVEMFDSLSYRRYLGERLTEAVVKEIEHRTPYKEASQRLAREIVNLMEIDPLPGVDGPPPGLVLPQLGSAGAGRIANPSSNGSLPGVSLPR